MAYENAEANYNELVNPTFTTGLRVFLMMAKRLGGGNVLVDNANALVRDIFETTGFADVVVIR